MSFIPVERIQLLDHVSNWQESIQEAARPLLEEKLIEEAYVKAMIENVEENGSYIVLAPHFALPHAGEREFVHETAMSLLLLEEAVDFNDEGEHEDDKLVRLLIVLAAEDSQSHLEALQGLANLLEDEDNITLLLEQDSPRAIEQVLNQLTGED